MLCVMFHSTLVDELSLPSLSMHCNFVLCHLSESPFAREIHDRSKHMRVCTVHRLVSITYSLCEALYGNRATELGCH